MSPRIVFLCAIYALPLIGGGIGILGWLRLRAFLNSHSSISSERDIDELKLLVKTNMFLALFVIAAYVLLGILGVVGIASGLVAWRDLIGLLILVPISTAPAAPVTATEKRVKSLPLEDETLREEFDHVIKRWTSSALPDW